MRSLLCRLLHDLHSPHFYGGGGCGSNVSTFATTRLALPTGGIPKWKH